MEIKKVNISGFRNIKNLVFFPQKTTLIKGNNTQGKTNVLNSICWCLTGHDLNGATDNLLNIPVGENETCVEVETNKGTIQRKTILAKDSVTQEIYINGELYPLKKVETAILDLFGLTQLSLKYKKIDFVQLLINPFYYESVTTKDLRKFVIDALSLIKDEEALIETWNTGEKAKNLIKEGLLLNGTTEKYANETEKSFKKNEKSLKDYETISTFLESRKDDRYKNQIDEIVKVLTKTKMSLTEEKDLIQDFIKHINKSIETENLSVVLLEFNRDGDGIKEVCYPRTFNDKVPFKNGSTAESICTSILFNYMIRKALEIESFPFLIDEGETLDNISLSNIVNGVDQLLITKVEFELQKGIKIEVGE